MFMLMERGKTIVTIIDQDTGATEARRLLSADEIEFTLRMAMSGSVWNGVPHAKRDLIKHLISAEVIKQFRMSSYRVYGVAPQAAPMNPDVYMGGNPDAAKR